LAASYGGPPTKTASKYMIQSKLKTKTLKERAAEGFLSVRQAHYDKCPECGGEVTVQEGCVLCHSCGWSACAS
jgi:hypothetical protein